MFCHISTKRLLKWLYLICLLVLYTGLRKKLKTYVDYCCFLKRKLAFNTILSTLINRVRGQALSRSYGRLFAEFLDEESLVPLGLLDLSTCVGLRYGQPCT
jgi:hypothetical protein